MCNDGIGSLVFQHDTKVLILSTGSSANGIHPFHFKDGVANRLPRFEISLPLYSADPVLNKQRKLSVKDISLALV